MSKASFVYAFRPMDCFNYAMSKPEICLFKVRLFEVSCAEQRNSLISGFVKNN